MSWFTSRRARQREATARRRPTARPQLEALEGREVPTVNYYGGALLTHVEAQALYYGNEWSSSTYSPQTSTLNSFLSDLTGGAYMQALTNAGYNVGTGTATTGAVDNTALTPGSVITDASIQSRLQADISSGLLAVPGPNRLYVVYVEPNVAVNLGAGQGTTQQGILGYHTAFAGHDAAGNPIAIHYAVVAYPGGSAGNSSLGTSAIDQLTAVSSHEVAEAATDPNVGYAQLGWYDPRRGEIGDITANNPNAYVRLDGYLVQEVANQNDQLLTLNTGTTTPPTNPSPVATTSTLTAGAVNQNGPFGLPTVSLTVTINPSSGTAVPGGVVELVYQGHVLGAARVHVVNGVATATFNVLFFGSGNFTFSAIYVGASQFQVSTSNSVTVSV
jgi:hypothetical protein